MANLMLSVMGAFAEFKRCLDSRTSARGNCIGQAAWRVLRTKEVISKCYKLLKRVKLCVIHLEREKLCVYLPALNMIQKAVLKKCLPFLFQLTQADITNIAITEDIDPLREEIRGC